MELMRYINDTYFKNSLPYRHTMIEQRFLGATRNHAHHFYEVVLVFRGACVHYCNGHEYDLPEGQISGAIVGDNGVVMLRMNEYLSAEDDGLPLAEHLAKRIPPGTRSS